MVFVLEYISIPDFINVFTGFQTDGNATYTVRKSKFLLFSVVDAKFLNFFWICFFAISKENYYLLSTFCGRLSQNSRFLKRNENFASTFDELGVIVK